LTITSPAFFSASARVGSRDLTERDRGSGDTGSGYIDDRSCHLRTAVERAAIMFDFEVERTALAGMANDASGAVFNIDGEVVNDVELAIWACASDSVKAASIP
jgi:hypothetical protein